MRIEFDNNVASRIGLNESILLNYLYRKCSDGRLIKYQKINAKNSIRRSFQRANNYRSKKQHLVNGLRYKRISMNVISWILPWISVPTIRNVINRLKSMKLIDVKHADRIINDNTNCYAVYIARFRKLQHDCAKDARPKPNNSRSERLHRLYTYRRSRLDPNLKPIINDNGVITGSIFDNYHSRWIL